MTVHKLAASLAIAVLGFAGTASAATAIANADFAAASITGWAIDTLKGKGNISHDATAGNVAPGSLKLIVTQAQPNAGVTMRYTMSASKIGIAVGDTFDLTGYIKPSSPFSMNKYQIAVQSANSRACVYPADTVGGQTCTGWRWKFVGWNNFMQNLPATQWTQFTIPMYRGADTVNEYSLLVIPNDTITLWFDDFTVTKRAATPLRRDAHYSRSLLSHDGVFPFSSSYTASIYAADGRKMRSVHGDAGRVDMKALTGMLPAGWYSLRVVTKEFGSMNRRIFVSGR
jgi:hypothetical protein